MHYLGLNGLKKLKSTKNIIGQKYINFRNFQTKKSLILISLLPLSLPSTKNQKKLTSIERALSIYLLTILDCLLS